MEAGTLIGYFAERDEARRALRELQRRGFPRAAWVHKTADGEIHIRDPFLWRRALGVTLTAIIFGSLAGGASMVLHGPMGTRRFPSAVLRESGDIPPAVFVLHPKRENPIGEVRSLGVPLSPTQIQEHAEHLAMDHEADPRPRRNAELLKRVENARQWIHQACSDLSEPSRLEQQCAPP